MSERFFATFDNDLRVWMIHESTGRLMADSIPTALWAEAMVEWMNGLELQAEPRLAIHTPRDQSP